MRFAVLLSNEWLKARYRMAARVPILVFTGVILLGFGGSYFLALRKGEVPPALPGEWGVIIGEIGNLSIFFVPIVVILLICSEFTWRTARQNIIDGLSTEEWFMAKVLLVPCLALTFLLLQLVIGGGFALAGTDFGALDAPLISTADLTNMAGYLLAAFGMGSLALMIAFLRRDSGPALAIFFVYATFGETLLALGLRKTELLADLIQYLPVTIFMQILQRIRLPTGVAERLGAAGLQVGTAAPPSILLIYAVAVGYTVVFLGVAFAVFRRRDL